MRRVTSVLPQNASKVTPSATKRPRDCVRFNDNEALPGLTHLGLRSAMANPGRSSNDPDDSPPSDQYPRGRYPRDQYPADRGRQGAQAPPWRPSDREPWPAPRSGRRRRPDRPRRRATRWQAHGRHAGRKRRGHRRCHRLNGLTRPSAAAGLSPGGCAPRRHSQRCRRNGPARARPGTRGPVGPRGAETREPCRGATRARGRRRPRAGADGALASLGDRRPAGPWRHASRPPQGDRRQPVA